MGLAMLDLYLEWVVLQVDVWNTFNLISWTTIFQELWFSIGTLDKFLSFVRWFYACPSPLCLSKASRHRDLIFISSESSTWQGDPLGGMLFALVHFHTFHPTIAAHRNYVFPSLINDVHIIGLTSNVLPFFVIIRQIWCIRTFNAVDKVCCLISIRV